METVVGVEKRVEGEETKQCRIVFLGLVEEEEEWGKAERLASFANGGITRLFRFLPTACWAGRGRKGRTSRVHKGGCTRTVRFPLSSSPPSFSSSHLIDFPISSSPLPSLPSHQLFLILLFAAARYPLPLVLPPPHHRSSSLRLHSSSHRPRHGFSAFRALACIRAHTCILRPARNPKNEAVSHASPASVGRRRRRQEHGLACSRLLVSYFMLRSGSGLLADERLCHWARQKRRCVFFRALSCAFRPFLDLD